MDDSRFWGTLLRIVGAWTVGLLAYLFLEDVGLAYAVLSLPAGVLWGRLYLDRNPAPAVSVEEYVVDMTKPPIPPPGRTFGNYRETKESIAQTEAWRAYIQAYYGEARKIAGQGPIR